MTTSRFLGEYGLSDNDTALFKQSGHLAKVVATVPASAVVISLYDNKSAGSGNRLFHSSTSAAGRIVEEWPDGLEFDNGLFCTCSGTNFNFKVELSAR